MNTEHSFCSLMASNIRSTKTPTGLVIAARKRGFWRNKAASQVEPERGSPDLKWDFTGLGQQLRVKSEGKRC